jgi:hypothetical protein
MISYLFAFYSFKQTKPAGSRALKLFSILVANAEILLTLDYTL